MNGTAARITAAGRFQALPLSFAQQRLWLSDQQNPSEAHHFTAGLRLVGRLDRQALRAALDRIVARHEILRTTFQNVNGEPVQMIGPAGSRFVLIEHDVGRNSAVKQIIRQEAGDLFELSRGPLIRGRLLRMSDQEHLLLITQHEIISDGRSIGVLTRELVALYEAFCFGQGDPMPPLDLQYADYASWQRQQVTAEVLKKQLDFWMQELWSAPELLQLPTDWPRPAVRSYASDLVQLRLSVGLVEQLQKLERQEKPVLFATLLSAWAVLLGRWSRQEDVVIGTRMPNRPVRGLEPLIGAFANTAALRVRLHDDLTIEQLVEQVRTTVTEASVHQDLPFERVVEALKPLRKHDPVFQVLLELNDTPAAIVGSGELQSCGLVISEVGIRNANTQLDLSLSLREGEEGLAGTLEYATDLFERETIERMAACWEVLLEAIVADSRQPISQLQMLTAAERDRVLQGFNKTAAAYPEDQMIHELFEDQVRRTPGAIAVIYEQESLTYSELNSRANQLARFLSDRGVGPDQLVALCVERSLDMVVGMLAVLKAGGAYVPLDPAYPIERLVYMLEDAAPRILLTQQSLRSMLPETIEEVITIDGDWRSIAEEDDENLAPGDLGLTARNLAFVIYTSGSTGAPKAAMNEHRGMVNRIIAQQNFEAFSEGDICCQKTSISFVDAVFEVFGALCNGLPLVIIPAADVGDSAEMAALIARQHVTRLVTVPSLARSMLGNAQIMRNMSCLRSWTLSGEEVRADLLMTLQRQLPTCEFIIQYGSSEVSSDAAIFKSTSFEGQRIPLGVPVPNVQIYVLDRHGEPVPIGVAGEIYVGGVGVGRGYLNRPDLTAARFLPDRFSAHSQDRLYKTGDLGRWRPDGMLEYLGRNDHQVKIRGFRIELGEIEAQLLRHGQVHEAVVVAREDVPGEKRLVAYVTLRESTSGVSSSNLGRTPERVPALEETIKPNGTSRPSVDALRAHLKAVLPEYMVPAAFVVMETMPRTLNGKLDRRALPVPKLHAYSTRQFEAPLTEREHTLAGIWRELLKLERVGRQDNFFELGGHSLLIVQMMERLRRVGLSAEVRSIYASSTLAALAHALVGETACEFAVPPNLIPRGCEVITPQMLPLVELEAEQIERIVQSVPGGARNIQDIYPLAPLQEGILFHYLLNEQGRDAYARSILLSLSSREKLEELIAALQKVTDRHDALRSAVLWEQLPRPVQVVYRQATLSVQELALDWDRDPIDQLKERMTSEGQRLNLRQAPLIRLQIAANPNRAQWYVLLQSHHLVCDNESEEIMLAEVIACIEGRSQGLPEPIPYRNHVAQAMRYARTHDAEVFFRTKLGDIDESTAPFGVLDVHGDGSRIECARQTFDPALAQRVRAQARRLAVSAATLFHAAWALVVSRTSGRDDVVYGTVLLGRMQGSAGAQRILGMFINTLPLRLQLQSMTSRELVEQTQRELVELLNYEQTSLAVAQRCSGIAGSAPLFSALMNYRHSCGDFESELASAAGVTLLASQAGTNYPVLLSVDDQGEGFLLDMKTERRIDPRRMLAYVSTAMQSLLDALEKAPQKPALALTILSESERYQVINLFNATQAIYPQEKLIHELFEEQVERTPNAIAAVYEGQSLTYAELNGRANQLARYLREKGIGPDRLVALCAERSVEMLVGLIGVLKAGGAYVPLDPNNPIERLRHILIDARPQVVLTHEVLKSKLPQTTAEMIVLDSDWKQIATQGEENLDSRSVQLSPRHLAYVIYTSGSTGKPKGVMVEHRSIVNYTVHALRQFEVALGDGSVICTSISFDLMLTGLYPTLLCGRTVRLCSEQQGLPALADEVLRSSNLAPLKLTPSHLTLLEEALRSGQLASRVRVLVLGGEPLQAGLVQLWKKHAPSTRIFNHYGPTETTVGCVVNELGEPVSGSVPIGRPIANMQIYILDRHLQPVPIGVAGEIYIGGAGVAYGYLNRPALTAERFIADPFRQDHQARLYRSGDLGRWQADGTLEHLGRNDDQVKIRGYRIELGEIEGQLVHHEHVKEAAIVAREDTPGEKRVVAYVTQRGQSGLSVEELRTYLSSVLPEYMVPSAFVMLERLPLTSNGKLDRRALPVPELGSYVSQQYETPKGEVEEILAGIWRELLKLERVGRQDNFFELGGHSLLIVQMMERLRRVGLSAEVRSIYASSTLAALAHALVGETAREFAVPPNLIPRGCEVITPQMLPLVELEAEQIERIVQSVPGGARNIQDIYPLAPLQEGMLFHHVLDLKGADTYVETMLLSVSSRKRLEEIVQALQGVIDRHDILRSAVLWEQLPRPVQVVYRQATLSVEELAMDWDRDPIDQLKERMKPKRQRLDLRRAPLMRIEIASDVHGASWYALLQLHHIVSDHESRETMLAEVMAYIEGRAQELPKPVPYRNHVAQALAHARTHDAEGFFRKKLTGIDQPTAPFGLLDVHADASRLDQFDEALDSTLARQVRAQARRLAVSAATLFHAAWALVVSRTSGRDDVVFGSVLLGRLQGCAGAQRMLGMFMNTLPLRLRLQGSTAKELVEQTQRELVELLSYEQISLAVAQRCSGIVGSLPLFSALLNYRHSAVDLESKFTSTTGVSFLAFQSWTNYPITLSVDDLGNGFVLTADTERHIDPRRIVGYMRTAMHSLVEALENAPQTLALALSTLPESEQHQLINLFNSTQAVYPQEKLIHELFEEQVERTPDAVAVVHEEQCLTYAELNARANQLARYLRDEGVGSDQLVGICVERSLDMLIGLLGILKAGGAYVPLDPTYPTERLQYMLEDAAPLAVLTQEKLRAVLPNTQVKVIWLDTRGKRIAEYGEENLLPAEIGLTARHLVYVIYTSGSTGRPKGTAMTHRSMVNLTEWHRKTFGASEGRNVLQFASLSFDVAIQEILSTLCTGATLVLLDEWVRRDARALAEFLSSRFIQILFVPPLMLQTLAEYYKTASVGFPRSLQDVITAGEQLRISAEIVAFFKHLNGCRLHNHYGPTETHVVTALTLTGDPGEWPTIPTIGQPISNTQIYVLDGQRVPVPMGLAGEIYIGGAGVARGYLRRPELSVQRFVPDPFSADPQARMYKTGDLGRWRADSTLEYLGRNDDQVKIRGYRIELGEIESQLARHAQVREAVVVVREDVPGERRLAAYITRRDQGGPSIEDLRAHLKAMLPEYMVPNCFVILESLPQTPSGKLDRGALPLPELEAYAIQKYEAPQGEVEEILAGIWQELLGMERVGRQDNFFEMGGHSLLMVHMVERLRRVGLSAEVHSVYVSPTLADLARTLTSEPDEQFEVPPNLIPPSCAAITPKMLPLVELEAEQIDRIVRLVPGEAANIQDIYPLAPLQEGILFHHLLNERGGDTYARPMLLSLSSRKRLEELIHALQTVIDRHDILRTAVLWEQLPRPVQVVYRRATLPVEELVLDRDRDSIEQLKERMLPERQRLDLRKAPLMRLQIAADVQADKWYALLQMHHIFSDHESLQTLIAEVMACMGGRGQSLPEPVPYRNHVAHALAYARTQDAEGFFRSKLGDIDQPTAPFGQLDVHGAGSRIEEACQSIEPALARRIRSQARRLSVSAATLFHAAWALVVARTSGRDDVVFGSVLLGRLQGNAGWQRTLGMFINTLPLRLRLLDITARKLVEQTQRELVELLKHEQASLAMAQRCSGIPGSEPLFSTLLNYLHTGVKRESEFAGEAGVTLLASQGGTNYPIVLSVDDQGEGFALTVQTDGHTDPHRMLGYISTALQSLVDALEQAPQTLALILPILPERERYQIVEFSNATPVSYPYEKLIHELFEEQVQRTPDAVAVVYEGQTLTYAHLNAKANQLAHHLSDQGVQIGEYIPIFMTRSLQMLIAQLAVLKSGGVYVPVDPNLPVERQAFMIRDCGARRILAEHGVHPAFEQDFIQWIDSAGITGGVEGLPAPNLRLPADTLPPAYAMYTSGSTGAPKGVSVPHRAVIRLAINNGYAQIGPTDCIAHCSNPAFDASTFEVWGALLNGARVLIVPQTRVLEASRFAEVLTEQRVTVLWLTVGLFTQYTEALAPVFGQLRYLLTGGDIVEPGAIRRVLRNSRPLHLLSAYGPTEGTTFSTTYPIERVDAGTTKISIGRPISNTQIHILDRHLQPVPIGVTGEIYIGGAGVALGYLNRPELTAERFIADPFSADNEARLYKSGDLGQWRQDGNIDFFGRNDQQVKLRGYRIELGEIEAQLLRHAQVKEAVVIAREDVPGEKRLIAYVVPRDPSGAEAVTSVEGLRAHLKAILPEYMVPSALMILNCLPLTSNGKLDRGALPAPEIEADKGRQYDPPQGEVESVLAEIWQELLRIERVGRYDNFFELGGHSLHGIKVIARVAERFMVRLSVVAAFQHPTVEQMAKVVESLRCVDEEPTNTERMEFEEGII